MDLLTLRTELETILVEFLGVYTLGNGARTPAISVRAEGEAMQADTSVEGLEAVLVRDPLLTPLRGYSYPGSFQNWTLFLVDWAGNSDVTGAADAVLALFPDSQIESVRVPEGYGPTVQRRITIRTVL